MRNVLHPRHLIIASLVFVVSACGRSEDETVSLQPLTRSSHAQDTALAETLSESLEAGLQQPDRPLPATACASLNAREDIRLADRAAQLSAQAVSSFVIAVDACNGSDACLDVTALRSSGTSLSVQSLPVRLERQSYDYLDLSDQSDRDLTALQTLLQEQFDALIQAHGVGQRADLADRIGDLDILQMMISSAERHERELAITQTPYARWIADALDEVGREIDHASRIAATYPDASSEETSDVRAEREYGGRLGPAIARALVSMDHAVALATEAERASATCLQPEFEGFSETSIDLIALLNAVSACIEDGLCTVSAADEGTDAQTEENRSDETRVSARLSATLDQFEAAVDQLEP